jgi:hypothetical protein
VNWKSLGLYALVTITYILVFTITETPNEVSTISANNVSWPAIMLNLAAFFLKCYIIVKFIRLVKSPGKYFNGGRDQAALF